MFTRDSPAIRMVPLMNRVALRTLSVVAASVVEPWTVEANNATTNSGAADAAQVTLSPSNAIEL